MEKEILNVLQSIDIKLGDIRNAICEPCEEKSESKEEDEIMNFLNDIAKELGIEHKVTIRKIEI